MITFRKAAVATVAILMFTSLPAAYGQYERNSQSAETKISASAKPKPKASAKPKQKKSTVTKKTTSSKKRTASVNRTSRSKVRASSGSSCDWLDAEPCGKNQRIGYELASARGWDGKQWVCLKRLWYKESGWSKESGSPSSGAFGIPQALPGSKMASAGSDWRTNPATQIKWGLGYISGRYGSPCSAWAHWKSHNWY